MEPDLKNIIKVLIVEDSPSVCKVLTDILNSDLHIMVTGVAHNGKEAVEMASCLKPNIITMDIHMPVMDGLEATKQIMARNPVPILIICASALEIETGMAFKAISYGALDIIEKGQAGIAGNEKYRKNLIEKIKFLSGIKVIRHPLAAFSDKNEIKKPFEIPKKEILDRIIAIATSTGGPNALHKILKDFPKKLPCGVVIVQHIATGFLEGLITWLNSECQIKVKIAENSEEICAGTVYMAPTDLQMRVEEGGRIHISNEPIYNGHRPSGDILLESVANVYKEKAIGVILTGMGRDGSMGIKAIKQMKGQTIAQDENSCAVFGMPKAAIDMGVADNVLPLENITEKIMQILRNNI
ncbi:MAG: chemotaxis-specific protein-glutamate methyltransferase CheB [Sedimentisphaerales bacterium]